MEFIEYFSMSTDRTGDEARLLRCVKLISTLQAAVNNTSAGLRADRLQAVLEVNITDCQTILDIITIFFLAKLYKLQCTIVYKSVKAFHMQICILIIHVYVNCIR